MRDSEQSRTVARSIVRASTNAGLSFQDWPQLSDEDYARLVDLEPDEMDREIRRILQERAPDKMLELDCGGDDV